MGIDPVSLAVMSLAATGLSAGVGAYGAMQSANAQAAADQANAQIAANNAQVAKQNASYAAAAGEQQAAMQEQKTRTAVGSEKAAEAANGLDVNSGSPVDVRSSTAALGEEDAINIRANAARQAYGYVTQAASYQGQESQYVAAAENAPVAGALGATTTLLGGIGNAGTTYAKFLNTGS